MCSGVFLRTFEGLEGGRERSGQQVEARVSGAGLKEGLDEEDSGLGV